MADHFYLTKKKVPKDRTIKNVKIWEHDFEGNFEPVSLPHWGAMAFKALYKAPSLERKQLQLSLIDVPYLL